MAKQKATESSLKVFEIVENDRRQIWAATSSASALKQHRELFRSTEPSKPKPAKPKVRQLPMDAKLTIETQDGTMTQDAAKFLEGGKGEGHVGEAMN